MNSAPTKMARDASYLSQQVNGIIGQLHGLFDEIGVSTHDREKREEELFHALSETLQNQVRLVTDERQTLVEDAQRMINAIQQMETALEDSPERHEFDENDLQVTYPLSRCLQGLKEKHTQISKLHRERFEQVKKLADALESYSSHLESNFVRVPLPPAGPNPAVPLNFDLSPAYVDKLDAEFTRVYDEYTQRVGTVQGLAQNIIQLWAELGTPQAQTDALIVKNYRDSPEQLGLHQEDLARLRARRDKLTDEKKAREKRLRDLRAVVEDLWGKLGVEEEEQKAFVNGNRGCGMRQINEYEDELARLHELKRQHLPAFVDDARLKLQELWDVLYFSEDEMLEFTPAFSDVYSDALLEAHEREIARLEALHEQRAPTLAMVDRHQTLIRERDDLAASSQDASRLMMRGQKGEKRDPGKLLREEKMRKRIAKELPKVTAELRKVLEAWEDEYGRPFLVHGERYLDTVEGAPTGAGAGAGAGATGSMRIKTAPAAAVTPSLARSTSTKRTPAPINTAASRNGNKTPMAASTMKRPAGAMSMSMSTSRPLSAVCSTSTKLGSPTRIPAASTTTRAPLGTLKHGTNSPERPRVGGAGGSTHEMMGGSLRSAPLLMRAPPPKMRDLVATKPDLETPLMSVFRPPFRPDSSQNVRQVEPEDVYDDRSCSSRSQSQQSYCSRSDQFGQSTYGSQSVYGHQPYQTYQSSQSSSTTGYPKQRMATGSLRHISDTSTAVSGSENWETYDDNSEPELDASETYYAKLRAARGKQFSEDGNESAGSGSGTGSIRAAGSVHASPNTKRTRGIPPTASAYAGHTLADVDGNRIVSGSEWTDEDAF